MIAQDYKKSEITLTDLAQSESSLEGARAKFITAETELLTAKTNFERIIRISAPETTDDIFNLKLKLPNNLMEILKLSESNNPKLLIAKLDYEIAQKDLNIEIANFSPTASINYSKSESKDFSSTVDNVNEESVKATLSWPIIKEVKITRLLKNQSLKKSKAI